MPAAQLNTRPVLGSTHIPLCTGHICLPFAARQPWYEGACTSPQAGCRDGNMQAIQVTRSKPQQPQAGGCAPQATCAGSRVAPSCLQCWQMLPNQTEHRHGWLTVQTYHDQTKSRVQNAGCIWHVASYWLFVRTAIIPHTHTHSAPQNVRADSGRASAGPELERTSPQLCKEPFQTPE